MPSITEQALGQAVSLLRTVIANETNSALLAAYADAGANAIEWISVLDDQTTDICEELDGKRWVLPEDSEDYASYVPIGHSIEFPGPVAHWQCRSTQIPVGPYDEATVLEMLKGTAIDVEAALQQAGEGEI